ncbi:MAG: zinc ribbon domain-containing protein [Chthonomonadales bacterium]|nr:zinc ribbon domain-containing protein [Chthonomonadales bacterium]
MNHIILSLVAAASAMAVGLDETRSSVVIVDQDRDLPVTVRAMVDVPGSLSERVSVDVRDQTVRDALKSVLEPAKVAYVVDEDVPDDVKVTIVAKDVRLRSVVDLIADAAGIGWQRELGAGKTRLRFGKGIRTWVGTRLGVSADLPERLEGLHQMLVEPLKEGVLWRAYVGNEERSSITCPHCKTQITRVSKPTASACPKCGVAFKPGWKVCPFDGTKRPEAPGEWKYCPVCGKALGNAK